MILKKLHDVIAEELRRYLNAEKKRIIGIFEKFWDKYRVSMAEITKERDKAAIRLNDFLKQLNYWHGK